MENAQAISTQALGSRFEGKIVAMVQAYDLLGAAKRVLVAVSGGADSMALLHALHGLRSDGTLAVELVCAHVNHQLRGPDSDADERFVQVQADARGLLFAGRRVDVTGFAGEQRMSLETAGRHLRMQALLDMARENDCRIIATGHQKNDNAETLIHRLARGTGLRGIAGIWPSRTLGDDMRLVRPLLGVTRQEVLGYLCLNDMDWREDATNADCRFRRNVIRHHLLPAVQSVCQADLIDRLGDLALATYGLYVSRVLPRVRQTWPAAVSAAGERGARVDVSRLGDEPPYVKIELLRQVMVRLGCGERDLAEMHYSRLLGLLDLTSSRKAGSLPGGFTARRQAGHLCIGPSSDPAVIADEKPGMLAVPGKTRYGRYVIEAVLLRLDSALADRIRGNTSGDIGYLDWDRLKAPLLIRTRRSGDQFHPLGLAADKRLGKFLTDARLPQEVRDHVLVVEDQEKIVWVCPVRISEQGKVTEATRQVVRLMAHSRDAGSDVRQKKPPDESEAASGKLKGG